MRRIVEAAGGILYRWKDDAEPTRASSPSVKSNIATDGTIIANTTDSDGETTAAPGASDAASTPDPAQADSTAQKVSGSDPATQLVFLTASRDTRFDAYGVLRPLDGRWANPVAERKPWHGRSGLEIGVSRGIGTGREPV